VTAAPTNWDSSEGLAEQKEEGMDYEDSLLDLAPCGLSCRKCFANIEGDIAMLSTELLDRLGSFGIYAERFSAFLPAFKEYPAIEGLLSYFAQGQCGGCREAGPGRRTRRKRPLS
jgi:hypothetical protein